jgi:hypothetical protein
MYSKPAGTIVLPLWYNGTPAPSTTTLTATPNPVSIGQTVTFNASTAGTVGTAAGNLSLEFSGTPLLTNPLSSGATSFTVPTTGLQPGTYALTANYAGSSTYAVSASPAYTVTVNAAPTTTTLIYSPDPLNTGQSVTFTAAVARTATGATGTPGGSVGFYYSTILLGSVPLSGGFASLTFPTAGIPIGSYVITAQYQPDSQDAASSATSNVAVAGFATSTAFTVNPSSVPAGSTTTLQAVVTRSTAAGTPTGTVTFYYQSDALITVALDNTGTATLPVSVAGIPAGLYSLTAAYNGDSEDAPSTSSGYLVSVQ